MKRKRGHKKGKKAKANAALAVPNEAAVNAFSGNSEDNSVNDEYDESGMDVDTPPSTRTDPALNVATIISDSSMDKPIGKSIGRVKVKLKTSSKVLETDVPSHSDTDKSSPLVGLGRQGGGYEKMEDSANSSAEMRTGVSGSVSRKAGSIKIKSSRMLAGSNADKSGNATGAERELSSQKERKMPRSGSRYNKQELDSALTVIKKVMKMEAAAPFNEPVNPEALGIPDYFDIIDTPMDFGTICNNLENGDKYMDSEDVFKDVQYIWDNCSKYNNKGDAILDLMRRVKKNFMKYWTAAGLYTEQSKGANGAEGGDEDGALSSHGKMQIKASQTKMKKKHGRRHKSDCLCAICVLKRRKREREANARMAKGQSGVQDHPHEDSSPVGTPYDEDLSLNMDESVDPYADAEVEGGEKVKREVSDNQYSHMEEKHEEEEDDEEEEEEDDEEEEEIKTINKDEGETKEQSEFRDRLSEERGRKSQPETVDKSGAVALNQKGSTPAQNEEESKAAQQQRCKESQEREQRSKMLENFRFENPMLLNLCGILFPDNKKSAWSGPHSLVQNRGSRPSPIHAAIETFMK